MINTTQERLTQGWTVWVYYLHMSNLQISIYLFKVILWLERELISFKSPWHQWSKTHLLVILLQAIWKLWNKNPSWLKSQSVCKWRSLQLHIWSLVTMLQTNTHTLTEKWASAYTQTTDWRLMKPVGTFIYPTYSSCCCWCDTSPLLCRTVTFI